MVKMRDEEEKKYPKFCDYLKDWFPQVVSNSRAMQAFYKWSKVPDRSDRCFRWGTEPIVVVGDIACHVPAGAKPGGVTYAMTFSERMIILDQQLALLMEEVKRHVEWNDVKDDDPLIIQVVDATLMHELVHWSWKKYGNDQESDSYGGEEDKGTSAFEQEAFGRILTLPARLFRCLEEKK